MNRVRPRAKLDEWNVFENELIEFAKANPIVYDLRLAVCKRGRLVDDLWKEFGDKWQISIINCRALWQKIRSTYFKMKTEPDQFSKKRKNKYLDGRLSFLDTFVQQKMQENEEVNGESGNSVIETARNTSDDLETVNLNTSHKDSSSSISLENCSSDNACGKKENIKTRNIPLLSEKIHTVENAYCNVYLKDISDTDNFTEFEASLIDYVKNYPFLYDLRVSLNIKSTLRQEYENKLWEGFSNKAGVSVSVCHEKWSKIRIEFFRVRRAQDDNIVIKKLSLLKYLDGRLHFLESVYSLIKPPSFNVMSQKQLEEQIGNRRCTWDDFELTLIEFVKENPIIYKHTLRRPNRKAIFRNLWTDFAKNFDLSADYCMKRWNRIKHVYLVFLRRQTGRTPDFSSLFGFRYKLLSFLNKTYVEKIECNRVSYSTFNENIDNASNLDKSDDATLYMEEKLSKLEPKEEMNLYDTKMEIEDSLFLRDMNFKPDNNPDLVSNNDKSQPSTSANFIISYQEDSENSASRNEDDLKSTIKEEYVFFVD